MRIISQKEVDILLSMPEAIAAVRKAFIQLSDRNANVPRRIHLSIEKRAATTLVMPAYLSETDTLACKIVSVFPNNPSKGQPIIYGILTLLDAETGKPLALIEGGSLTALRTGAASGLATDLLARKDSENLAVVGAGTQSKKQIEGVCAVRKIRKIWIFDHNFETAARLVKEIQNFSGAEVILADSSRRAVAEADIICTATTSGKPVFDGNDLRNGTHINGIGSFTKEMQEIDFTTLRRAAKIVVDSTEGCLNEAGDLVQAIEQKIISETDIYAEIGEIASGLKIGRENQNEITFFKSVGNAAQDAATASAIYQLSISKQIGIEVDL